MRRKVLQAVVLGEKREFGEFETSIHSDILSTINAIQREVTGKGRPITLSAARQAAVEEALAHSTMYPSTHAIRQAMKRWHEGRVWGAADINKHYSKERAEGYHVHNTVSQARLSARVLDLAQPSRNDLCLDLACGSGLSTRPLAKRCGFVIGTDLSEGMLAQAHGPLADTPHDLILHDMGQPLPFRCGVFDHAISVSAVHYLLADAPPLSAEERLANCLSGLRRCVAASGTAVFQLFPPNPEPDMEVMLAGCDRAGLYAVSLCDKTHHTDAVRWYLWVSQCPHPQPPPPRSCRLNPTPGPCFLSFEPWLRIHHPSCPLPATPPHPYVAPDHVQWLRADHQRQAKRLVRCMVREEETGADILSARERDIGRALRAALGEGAQAKTADDAHWDAVEMCLHPPHMTQS